MCQFVRIILIVRLEIIFIEMTNATEEMLQEIRKIRFEEML